MPQVIWLKEPVGIKSGWSQCAAVASPAPKVRMDAYLAAFGITVGLNFVSLDKDLIRLQPLGLLLELLPTSAESPPNKLRHPIMKRFLAVCILFIDAGMAGGAEAKRAIREEVTGNNRGAAFRRAGVAQKSDFFIEGSVNGRSEEKKALFGALPEHCSHVLRIIPED